MATPAIVTTVRNGRRRHSFKASWLQVMSFTFQRTRRVKTAGLPGRVDAGKQPHHDAHGDALNNDIRAHREKSFVGGERQKSINDTFKGTADGECQQDS